MLSYMTANDAAEKWKISHRRVITLCKENRIPNTAMLGNMWIIPIDAEKPADGRRKLKNRDTRHFTITIEETVCEDFDIISDNIDNAIIEAIDKYETGEFVLEPGNVGFKQVRAYDGDNSIMSNWEEF